MYRNIILACALIMVFTISATAQEQRSEIGLQGTGFFSRDAGGRGVSQHSTDVGGFLVDYRYHLNRWLAADATYGYNRNTQEYGNVPGFSRVQSDIHQITGGVVLNVPRLARLRLNPYVLAEGGALVFRPTGNAVGVVPGASDQTRGVFVYGGGASYPLSQHFSLRAEYRGLVYNTPDFGLQALNTNSVTHTAQPSAGIVFRF